MRVLVTGGTGFVGRFIVEALLAEGHAVVVAGRQPPTSDFFARPVASRPFSLDPDRIRQPLFDNVDALVHTAFHHIPGKYRGGEGDDPAGFMRLNRDGSIALFEAAKSASVRRAVFLSSRAVYGTQPPGTVLTEDAPPRPDTLYGTAKLAAEEALTSLCDATFRGVSLRATGIYGPPGPRRQHKWESLFQDFAADRPIAPRRASEVHGRDLADAVLMMLTHPTSELLHLYNVSDIMVDRRDLLAIVARETGIAHALPEAGETGGFNEMATSRLRSLGWKPGGRPLFEATVRDLAARFQAVRER